MNIKETIQSWRWRIVRAGYTQSSFCEDFNISRGAMSEYLAGKKSPSLDRFEQIEGLLQKIEGAQ